MNAGIVRVFMFLLLFLWFVPAPARAVDEPVIELVVQEKDNLINLCKKHLEDPRKWPEVARINKLQDYNYLRPGSTLVIPVRLLRNKPVDGRVVFIKGDVAFQTAKEGPWTPLQMNDLARQGSVIRTGRESAVEVAYPDGTSFYLAPEAVLELTASRQQSGSPWQRFLLSAGRILTKIRRATGAEPRVEIQTPAAVFLARGTEFRVATDIRESSSSEVLQGTVDAEAAGRTVSIREGEGTRVNKGEPPLPPRKLLSPPALTDIKPLYDRMPFALQFGRIEGAVAYRVLLSRDPDGKDVVREQVVTAGEPLEVAGLENGVYYLQSRSVDDIGLEGASAAPQTITVQVRPQPPEMQPHSLSETELRLAWTGQADAAAYHVQISRDEKFTDLIVDQRVSRPELTLPRPEGKGTCSIRISAIDQAGLESDFSPPRTVELGKRLSEAVVFSVLVGLEVILFLVL